jgi:hypothetical protein
MRAQPENNEMKQDPSSRSGPRKETIRDAGTPRPDHDYVRRLTGFRCGGGICRIRVYRAEKSGDAPVVICSELPAEPGAEAANIALMAGYLAAQVIREHFPGGLPDLPRPMLWIEQRLTFEGDPQEYTLVSFPFYRPRSTGLGTDEHATLGTPRREPIDAEEVTSLVT